MLSRLYILLFFFNDTATTEIYTLSLHDALPISQGQPVPGAKVTLVDGTPGGRTVRFNKGQLQSLDSRTKLDRKSTRLNSSHVEISYAVFCLKKKKKNVKYDIGICRLLGRVRV